MSTYFDGLEVIAIGSGNSLSAGLLAFELFHCFLIEFGRIGGIFW